MEYRSTLNIIHVGAKGIKIILENANEVYVVFCVSLKKIQISHLVFLVNAAVNVRVDSLLCLMNIFKG